MKANTGSLGNDQLNGYLYRRSTGDCITRKVSLFCFNANVLTPVGYTTIQF